jgi:hypothetical protein
MHTIELFVQRIIAYTEETAEVVIEGLTIR